ncbi:protein disulfide-isomerase domain [Pneumocystis murina B123]|uniref:protein disulfide-isomerase n=1 Tax=Pneumocystis murina (strain B123) TaxID=1069680 RepID=M7P925_PNEMU|nr:protein disulfide-isomerase domain [Pneumocystis murina B123]EMR10335.1 protein disulfide-isomerase domain [Pneumocystis murina B123]
MKFIFFAIFLNILNIIRAKVLELTPETFYSVVGKDKPALVKFYAPWCGHCKRLEPIYDELSSLYQGKNIIIARVNADIYNELGKKFEIRGFPTIKWFNAGSLDAKIYDNDRNIQSFTDFIEKRTGIKARGSGSSLSVPELTPETFNEIVFDPKKDVLVKFYAPWCGHCKKLEPIYERIHKCFSSDKHVSIVKFNADYYKDFAKVYNIEGFPTLKLFLKGSLQKTILEYNGPNTELGIVSFINKNTGTSRVPGGDLSSIAGRINEFDAIIKEYKTSNERDILSKLKDLASKSNNNYGLYYVKVLEKAMQSADYVENEYKRLERLLKNNFERKKRDDIQIRKNILSVFRDKGKLMSNEL